MNEDPLVLPDERDESFLRAFLLVLAVHVGLLAGIWLLSGTHKKTEQITWLDGSGAPGKGQAACGARTGKPPAAAR